jgi:hypothetical protein
MFTKYVYSRDQHVSVSSEISVHGHIPSGIMRWNSTKKCVEIMSNDDYGSPVHEMPGTGYSIGVSPETNDILDWAQRKMQEEREIDIMCQQNAVLSDLKNKFLMTAALIRQGS